MKVLVAEDEPDILEGLVEILEAEGYTTVRARDGAAALARFHAEQPDFVLLDVMMPRMNGYDVCREIRAGGSRVPVIFISAKSEEIDRVLGLELGADDFIMKPFGVREVIARVRAVTRRSLARAEVAPTSESFAMGDLEVRPAELRAYRGGVAIDLSLRDVKILALLVRESGKVVDRNTLMNECWGLNYLPSSRTLDQHISKLRKRVEPDPRSPALVRTVHGVGYRYDPA